MARHRDAWARGAEEAKLMDRARMGAMSHDQRVAEGVALIRIAEKLRSGRRDQTPR